MEGNNLEELTGSRPIEGLKYRKKKSLITIISSTTWIVVEVGTKSSTTKTTTTKVNPFQAISNHKMFQKSMTWMSLKTSSESSNPSSRNQVKTD